MNEEYLSYVDYLKSVDFSEKLEVLKEKYAGKKILLYGTGAFLDAILDNYNISEYLNVIGISDKRLENSEITEYKGINFYKTTALIALNFNVVLDTSVLFEKTAKFLKKNMLIRKTVVVEPIVQISFKERLNDFFEKQIALFKYLIVSKNLLNTVFYSFICTTEEIIVKTNYIKKIVDLRKSDKQIRTAFICSNPDDTSFMGLYNLLYFDKSFKTFPVILIPDNLLETDPINEENMQKKVEHFKTFNSNLIDGYDRETHEMPVLHAFKPDLVFYQNPIYIKDDFSPAKMSKNALCFTVPYNIKNSDFTAIGSKFYRKQVANMWRVFVNDVEDKEFYSQYTDLTRKNVVVDVKNKSNSGIVAYLLKTLHRN